MANGNEIIAREVRWEWIIYADMQASCRLIESQYALYTRKNLTTCQQDVFATGL
jgi:hypothetical protein